MSLGVIGGGKWGSALHFAFKEHKPLLYSRSRVGCDGYASLDEILKCEYLVFALPAQAVKEWLEENFINYNQKILVVAKGIHVKTTSFLNEIFSLHVNEKNLAFLSGPSFAAEVIKSLPTAVVINSKNQTLSDEFSAFFPSFMKTYTSTDVIGAEICGAYKNVIAIASGICDGLELGNNARASLIARGLVEMQRFGKVFGGEEDTFLGLSGAGDLFLTASSTLSRNFRVGLGLAKGMSLDEILEDLGEVAEGVYTSQAIEKLSSKHDIYTPIAKEVVDVLDGKKARDSLRDLLGKNS